jgi:cytochrome P450
MLFQDPPSHARLRTLVCKAFSLSLIQSLRPHIQRIVDGLLARVRDTGAIDLIADSAFPLPVYVIVEMLGVPPADRDLFCTWSLDIARGMETPPASPVFERMVAAHCSLPAMRPRST